MSEWLTLIALSFGLSMDAAAVSLCNGLSISGIKYRQAAFTAAVFGVLQGLMPLAGYSIGYLFLNIIGGVLPYISFGILALVGAHMLFEGITDLKKKEEAVTKNFKTSQIIVQGVATSIDALATGVSLLGFSISIYISSSVIAAITFSVCFIAVILGKKFGKVLSGKNGIADIIGGTVLLIIAITFLIP